MRYLRVLSLDIKNLFTNIAWLFYGVGFPLLLIIILGYLTRNDYGTRISSYDYYGVAMLLFSVFNTGTIAANSFMEEKIKAGNMRIIFSPIHPSWIYLSKIIAAAIFDFICHMIVIGILIMCFQFHIGQYPEWLLLMMFIGEILGSAVGVSLCCVLKSESACNQVLSLITQLAAVIGGVFFSLDRFGDIFMKLSYISPIKWMIQSCFLCIYDSQLIPIYLCLLVMGIGICICLMICQRTWHKEDCL